jgi:hypothetical protein
LSRGWSAISEEEEGGLNTRGQKLAVTVQNRVTLVLPTRCQYYRHGVGTTEGGVRTQIVRLIGSTDTGSVVPTP